MVSDELIRVAILWHEQWHEGLEEASRHGVFGPCLGWQKSNRIFFLCALYAIMSQPSNVTNMKTGCTSARRTFPECWPCWSHSMPSSNGDHRLSRRHPFSRWIDVPFSGSKNCFMFPSHRPTGTTWMRRSVGASSIAFPSTQGTSTRLGIYTTTSSGASHGR